MAAECYAEGEGLNVAIAGSNSTFLIVARDRFNNTLYNGLPSSFAFSGSVTEEGGESIKVEIEAARNGTYVGSYNVIKAGNYALNVYLSPPDQQHIAGSPFGVSVLASASLSFT